MPEVYDRWLAPAVFRPFAVEIAQRGGRLNPRRVLELAAGTGVLTRELVAALPNAEVTATDLNAAMVDYASSRVAGARWRQADALRLPFDDQQFDLVVCQFGVMFFPDKAAAFGEVRRVLMPGGTLLFSTWATVETHGFEAALLAGVERAFPDDPPTFVRAVQHGYSQPEQVAADLAAGGLVRESAEEVTLVGQSASAADLARGYCTGTPLRAQIESRGDLSASTLVVGQEMRRLLGDGPVTAKMTAYVIEARPRA